MPPSGRSGEAVAADEADPAADPAAAAAEADPRFRNRIVSLEHVSASELSVHPKNWRLHPEKQRSALIAAMETIGVADAVIAYRSERNEGALTLIDGHLRRDVLESVPVLVTDLSDEEADVLLASHDVITTLAHRDEDMLASLLDDIDMQIPRDLMLAIDPDLAGSDVDETGAGEDGADARYPIVPEYDEGYDSVIIFATREADWGWLMKELELPVVQDRKRIGLSHVMTVEQFRDWLSSRSS